MALGTTLNRIKWPALNGATAVARRDWLALLRIPENGLLELRLPPGWPESAGTLHWQWYLGGSVLERGEVQRLSELPAFTQGATVRLWTPAAETLLTETTLPTRSRARILQALPFALEDQLLGEPQSLHFVYVNQADGRLAVAVTARTRMEAWIGALRAAGLIPDSVCPDSLQLPVFDKAWTLRHETGLLTIRSGQYSGFSLEQAGNTPPFLLDRALQEARRDGRAPEQLLFEHAPDEVDLQAWSAALGLPVDVAPAADPARPALPPLNLLQNEYVSNDPARRLWQTLRPALLLFAAAVLLQTGLDLHDSWRLSREDRAQRQEMLDLFRRTFPEAKSIVDPALQMERSLAALAGNSANQPQSLLPLLERSGRVLPPGGPTKLRALHYADSQLTLELTAPDFQSLETLRGGFAAQGLDAETLSADNRNNAVEARLRLRAPKR